jgi:DNA invertase Pin-like site-specific DNA recombinase
MIKKKTKKTKAIPYSKLENKVAAVWTRVSTERQADNNGSLDNQLKICKEYAERKGIRIKKYFGGTNESAKTEGKLYKDMIAEVAKDKEINVILVYSFDRFTRSGPDGIATKAYLKTKGIYVISATQATDPDSATGKFMEDIIFIFNQFDNDIRRDSCVNGMKGYLRNGYWYSKPPLGYDQRKEGKTHILTVNSTGKILRKAFIWKATEGISDIEIVRRLGAEGLTIDRKHLNKILHKSFYCGYITHSLLGDEIIKGKQEILIDEETFNKINRITKQGYEHKEITEEFPLKRHVICSDCGGYLTGYTVKAKGRDYYKCNKKGCRSNHSTEKLHQKYASLLNTYRIPTELTPILSKVLKKVFNEYNEEKCETRKTLLKRETECNSNIKKVQIRYGLGEIGEDVYRTTIEQLNANSAEIKRGLEESSKNLSNLQKFVDKVIVTSCNLGSLWNNGDFQSRQQLQKLVFPDGVVFHKENIAVR